MSGGPEAEPTDGLNGLPIPPRELIQRTDLRRESESDERLRSIFEQTGAARLRGLRHALPDGFDFDGKRVLDFGCGGGRVLRQLAPWADSGEFWGCDTYEPTVAWLSENLSPPFRFYLNDKRPLPHPDGYLDLVYAISVFTHITHEWAEWLLELHRVLKPDGLLAATFIGPASWERSLHRLVEEDQLGVAMLRLDQPYAQTSGPLVLHSPWWIRAHWGRAFDVLTLWPHGFAWPKPPGQGDTAQEAILAKAYPGHGVFVGRKRAVSLTTADLLRPEPDDRREDAAARQQETISADEAGRASS